MLAHSLFVVVALTGVKLNWKSPPREAAAVPWRIAFSQLAPMSSIIALLAVGIAALLPKASSPALAATIVGGVVVGALLLYVTASVAHRPVTTELPLIVVWATVQLAAGITLRTAGVLEAPAASAWSTP